MSELVQLAVAGAGLMGRRHTLLIKSCRGVKLTAIVDPVATSKDYADSLAVQWYPNLDELFRQQPPEGIVLATPNRLHVEHGLRCFQAGCPVLMEKPLASTAAEADILVTAARKAGLPLLVGHHRRHNPITQKARELIDSGRLGQLRSIHINCWLYKPADYFQEAKWRTEKGAGPLAVNFVHDLNVALYLYGDVSSVLVWGTPSERGHDNEDLAVILLRFRNGMLGTVNISDNIVAPWSWEMTARENPVYPHTNQSSMLIGGSKASLSLPDLNIWQNEGPPSWWNPMSATTMPRDLSDPFLNQISHFAKVIRNEASPLVSGEEGLKTLQVLEAVQKSLHNNREEVISSLAHC